jgi:hypothetical protein
VFIQKEQTRNNGYICGKYLKRNIMKGKFRYVSGTTIPALLLATFVFIVHSLSGLEDRVFWAVKYN